MDVNCFKAEIEPLLNNYALKYSSFHNGDFGDLDRVEFEGSNKVGTIDFWSKGWVNIDIYDCIYDVQLINLLLEPDEVEEQKKAMKTLLKILTDE